MSAHDLTPDIEAVRQGLLRLRDSDEMLGTDDPSTDSTAAAMPAHDRSAVRRALVDELIGFLDARKDIVDLQAARGLDPVALLLLDDADDAR